MKKKLFIGIVVFFVGIVGFFNASVFLFSHQPVDPVYDWVYKPGAGAGYYHCEIEKESHCDTWSSTWF